MQLPSYKILPLKERPNKGAYKKCFDFENMGFLCELFFKYIKAMAAADEQALNLGALPCLAFGYRKTNFTAH